jgi:membrane protease YdiL (CAAX protease family)
LPRSSSHSTRSGPDRRTLVVRTSGIASEDIYGLILATSVIGVSRAYDPADAGRVGLAVLVSAVVFSLAHVYANTLGRGVSEELMSTRAEVAQALRDHWSLVEVVIPLLLVLGLGTIGVMPDGAALAAATSSLSWNWRPQAAKRGSGTGPARAGP